MFLVASAGADFIIDKEVASGSRNVIGWTVLNRWFKKWSLTLRKPSASFVAVKSEHIDIPYLFKCNAHP